MIIEIQKLDIFRKIVTEKKITPSSPKFEESVVALIKEKIAEKTDLNYVDSDLFSKIDRDVRLFKSKMKTLYSSSKVFIHSFYLNTYYMFNVFTDAFVIIHNSKIL